ncbi:MAG TPA: hypothetical protein VJQ49_05545 [Casimicrobiaceae bacterium]|nr:hypothetical protein [Casimicrobiaceae bacterium]
MLPSAMSALECALLQEKRHGADAGFVGIDRGSGKVRALGVPMQRPGRQALLLGILRENARQRADVEGGMRLQSSLLQEQLSGGRSVRRFE